MPYHCLDSQDNRLAGGEAFRRMDWIPFLVPTQVAFVPRTHYVFTVGKDRLLKYWDADRWELLLELRGHHAEVTPFRVGRL